MITFNELLELCKAEALSDKLIPTHISVWENICRQYSKAFFTPLHEVMKMDPEYVMRQVFANQLDEVDPSEHIEHLDDSLHELEDPNWSADAEEDLQKFLKEAEAEEAERVAKGIPLKKIFRKGTKLSDHVPAKKVEEKPTEPKQEIKELPKSGGIDLSSLANDENER